MMCSLPHCSAYIGQILSLFCVIGKGFDDVVDIAVTYLGLTLPNIGGGQCYATDILNDCISI